MNETPTFFYNRRGARLFGVHHVPEENASGLGVVLVHPFFEEKLWAHRVYVSFARELARRGHAAFRFDAFGHGDSDGDHREMTLDTLVDDLSAAVSESRQGTPLRKSGILALRGGAPWALRYTRGAGTDFLLLWQPVTNMGSYFQECLRSNVATQMMLYGEPRETRQKMVQRLKEGGVVGVDGYMVGKGLYEQMVEIRLAPEDLNGIPTLVVQIDDRDGIPPKPELAELARGGGGGSAMIAVRDDPFWRETRTYVQRAESLFSATLGWLEGQRCDK